MYKNDSVLPFFGLLLAVAFWYMAYLDGQHLAALAGHPLEDLSGGQIGLITFGAVFFIYGVMGYVSYWLEGEELRPGRHESPASIGAGVVIAILTIILVALSGLLVQTVIYWANEAPVSYGFAGRLAGYILLDMAAILVVYKKYFVAEVVITEDDHHAEVPW